MQDSGRAGFWGGLRRVAWVFPVLGFLLAASVAVYGILRPPLRENSKAIEELQRLLQQIAEAAKGGDREPQVGNLPQRIAEIRRTLDIVVKPEGYKDPDVQHRKSLPRPEGTRTLLERLGGDILQVRDDINRDAAFIYQLLEATLFESDPPGSSPTWPRSWVSNFPPPGRLKVNCGPPSQQGLHCTSLSSPETGHAQTTHQ
jgi:hypothetical protein